jgi:hypothetical protein
MNIKERMVRLIEADARDRVAELSGEFARAASQEKEGILAELEFERWLADCCPEARTPL